MLLLILLFDTSGSSKIHTNSMHLKRLEIQGFKTFAGRTVFEFRPGITAVVGPNGSGKSNLADAVRWVLGEQSFAALRCKKTEELLFSGGPKRAPVGFAEVALTIDNSDRLLPLDFDEVTITRRATRAGDNEYYINRARVRLRDVQQATEPLGGSYTIINQGLVDTALTLRPEERRRLFEDAAEIGGFELRKADALRRLRETDSNLNRISDLIGELEPRLRSLKRQAGQARQHRELSSELHVLQQKLFAGQARAARSALSNAEQELARREQELATAREQQQLATRRLRSLRDELRSRREQLGALHQQSSALHRRAEAAQRSLAVADERVAALARRAEDLERARRELLERRDEALAQQTATAAALEQARAELSEQQAAFEAMRAEQASAETARRSRAAELRAAEDAAYQAAAAQAEQRSRGEQLLQRRERLLAEQARFAQTLQAAAGRREAAAGQLAGSEADVARLEQAQATLQATVDQARADLEALRAERTAADEALAAARRHLADVEARRDSLERLARSHSGTFAGVRAALQWAERNGRAGFRLVSSILRTPPQYETALEVALGSRLQNIVVEHWQDAEDAIADLKRGGAGRATFLPLDTLRGRDAGNQPAGGAGVHGVAAELVDYDELYREVAWYLLGRVLLVDDLAVARRELRRLSGGWQIVTLAGEQVNSGGAVTGGAQTKDSGTLRRERELRELPGQVAAAQNAVAEAEAQRQALDARLARATQVLREAEHAAQEQARLLNEQRKAQEATRRELARAEQEHDWQEQRRAALSNDLAELADAEQALNETLAAAEAATEQAQVALNELRTRNAQDAEADQALQERLSTLRAGQASAESQVRAQQALLNTHQRALAQLEQQEAARAREQEQQAAEREQLFADRARSEAEQQSWLVQIDELRRRIDPAEAALAADEQRLPEFEQAEEQTTATLLEAESAQGRAAVEAQRARDRLDGVYERAFAENIEPDEAAAAAAPLSAEELAELQEHSNGLKARLERIGPVNPLALDEYDEAGERHQFLSEQVADLREARATLQDLISELEATMRARFNETFRAVAAEFEQSFTRLFGGGSARLQLVGEEDGADEEANASAQSYGVEIIARPPGKRQQNLSLLSGGERALTAAALLFAILRVNPSPFCMLDEVDAALDESNVGRFNAFLADLTKKTQFVLITHNRGTIEAADTIYGVSMGEDSASRVLSLRVEELIGT